MDLSDAAKKVNAAEASEQARQRAERGWPKVLALCEPLRPDETGIFRLLAIRAWALAALAPKGPFAGVVLGGQLVCPQCGVRPSEGHVFGCAFAAGKERDDDQQDDAEGRTRFPGTG